MAFNIKISLVPVLDIIATVLSSAKIIKYLMKYILQNIILLGLNIFQI